MGESGGGSGGGNAAAARRSERLQHGAIPANFGCASVHAGRFCDHVPVWRGLLMRRGAKGTERLPGVRVLVTRPASAAVRLADAFVAEGAVVHRVPALAIAPVEDRGSVERLRRRLPDVCAIVFTSVNAVEGFFGAAPGATPGRPSASDTTLGWLPTPDAASDRLPSLDAASDRLPSLDAASDRLPSLDATPDAASDRLPTPDTTPDRLPASDEASTRLPAAVLAVGPATAEALRARGVVDVRIPPGRFDSEGLLACAPLEAGRVAGRLVAVIKGEGGRDLLGKELVRRGAEVVEANVYRRRPPERLAERLEAVRESIDLVTVTSAEALENLVGAAPWIASWLSDRMLVTVSERVAGIARAHRLPRVFVAAGADAASIVDAAARAVADSGEAGTGEVEPGEVGVGEAGTGEVEPDEAEPGEVSTGEAGTDSATDIDPGRCGLDSGFGRPGSGAA